MKRDVPDPDAPGFTTLCLRHLTDVPQDVTELFEQAEQQDPQFSLGWFRNLADTVFGPEAEMCIHVLRRKGQAVAALPVVDEKVTLGRKIVALGNYYTSLFAPAIAPDLRPDELALLISQVVRSHAPLNSIQLAPMAPENSGFRLLKQAMTSAGLVSFDYFSFGNWYLPVTCDAEQYLAGRPSEVRNTLRRMGKKFASTGGRFEIVTDCDQALDAAAAFTQIYQKSWKKPEPYPGFIPGLTNLCAQQGWLRMGFAIVGSEVVAAQFWIVAAGKASIYKLAYDPAFRKLSPGSLLTAHLMQHVIDIDKVKEVDYLTGDDAYKSQWMSHRRERRGLIAYNPRTLGGLTGLVRETGSRKLKLLLRRPYRDTESAAEVTRLPSPTASR